MSDMSDNKELKDLVSNFESYLRYLKNRTINFSSNRPCVIQVPEDNNSDNDSNSALGSAKPTGEGLVISNKIDDTLKQVAKFKETSSQEQLNVLVYAIDSLEDLVKDWSYKGSSTRAEEINQTKHQFNSFLIANDKKARPNDEQGPTLSNH